MLDEVPIALTKLSIAAIESGRTGSMAVMMRHDAAEIIMPKRNAAKITDDIPGIKVIGVKNIYEAVITYKDNI